MLKHHSNPKEREHPWLKTEEIPGNTGTLFWMYSVALRYR